MGQWFTKQFCKEDFSVVVSSRTHSKAEALGAEFGVDGERVFAKNFDWFVMQEGGPIPFFSGMRLA